MGGTLVRFRKPGLRSKTRFSTEMRQYEAGLSVEAENVPHTSRSGVTQAPSMSSEGESHVEAHSASKA